MHDSCHNHDVFRYAMQAIYAGKRNIFHETNQYFVALGDKIIVCHSFDEGFSNETHFGF